MQKFLVGIVLFLIFVAILVPIMGPFAGYPAGWLAYTIVTRGNKR